MLRVDLQTEIEGVPNRRFMGGRGQGLVDVARDPAVIAVFVLSIIVAAFAFYLDYAANQQYDQARRQVRLALQDSTSLQEDLRQAERLRERRTNIRARINRVRTIDENRYSFVHVMDQVANAVPADVWVDAIETRGMDLNSGNVTFEIRGHAATNNMVSDFINRLEGSPFLRSIGFEQARYTQVGIQRIVQFTLVGTTTLPEASFLEVEAVGPEGERRPLDTGAREGGSDTARPPASLPESSRGGGEPPRTDTSGDGELPSLDELRRRSRYRLRSEPLRVTTFR